MAKRKPKQRALAEHIDGPTETQLANGDYASALLPDPHINHKARVHLNRGGTTLAKPARLWLLAGHGRDLLAPR